MASVPFHIVAARRLGQEQKMEDGGGTRGRRERLQASPTILKIPFVHERDLFIYLFIYLYTVKSSVLHYIKKKNNNTVLQDCLVGARLTIFVKSVNLPFKTSNRV